MPDDEHVIHMWTPFSLKLAPGYDYRRAGFLGTAWYYFFHTLIAGIILPFLYLWHGLRVRGRGNVKALGRTGAVTVCNHVHMLDCAMIAGALGLRRTYYTTLPSNFGIPVVRHLIRGLGAVPITHDREQLNELFDAMGAAVAEGDYVHFYPEGVLVPYDTRLRAFKKGAFHLAVRTGSPVLPMVISYRERRGLYRLLRRKPCVTLTVLPPQYPAASGDAHADVSALCDSVAAAMSAALADLR